MTWREQIAGAFGFGTAPFAMHRSDEDLAKAAIRAAKAEGASRDDFAREIALYARKYISSEGTLRERRSVHLTNAALLAMFGTLALSVGWREVLTIHLSIMVIASILGVWLFSLQHRFETARWARREEWDPAVASMEASSWFGLPRVLHWLTGNIGFHHVHHLNTRVPSYRLRAAHATVQALWPIEPLSLAGGLRAPWLTLWDEAKGRLVSFREAARAAA